ncbi:hypothetical protein BRC68_07030 [Halobacteriales archaeon QH_6_64_20]|nr:MAG: hypothetical protein BRC68_07030 [Halobacteriales archaeon QH_6_64_20]
MTATDDRRERTATGDRSRRRGRIAEGGRSNDRNPSPESKPARDRTPNGCEERVYRDGGTRRG